MRASSATARYSASSTSGITGVARMTSFAVWWRLNLVVGDIRLATGAVTMAGPPVPFAVTLTRRPYGERASHLRIETDGPQLLYQRIRQAPHRSHPRIPHRSPTVGVGACITVARCR